MNGIAGDDVRHIFESGASLAECVSDVRVDGEAACRRCGCVEGPATACILRPVFLTANVSGLAGQLRAGRKAILLIETDDDDRSSPGPRDWMNDETVDTAKLLSCAESL